MSGTYTINPSGSGSTNYTSIGAAVSALNSSGVNGAVVFSISDGTYTGQVSLSAVTGASATNTITFKSASGHWQNVTITNSSTYTIYNNGGDYYRFEDVTIENTNRSTYYNIRLQSGAEYNKFTNCRIKAGTNFGYNVWNYYNSHNEFVGNRVVGGYYSLYNYGARGSEEEGLLYKNNRVVGYYYYGIYYYGQEGAQIIGNTCDSAVYQYSYGIYSNTSIASTIMDNEALGNYSGMYLFNENRYSTSSTDSTIFANNISRNNTSFGCYLYYSSSVDFHHNVVESGTSYSLYMYAYGADAGKDLRFANNIFVSGGGYYGLYYSAYDNTTASQTLPDYFDYNDFYINNTTYFAYFAGSLVASFTALQNAHSSAYNQNSVVVDPDFQSPSDGRTYAPGLNNVGVDMGIDKDIDGNDRPNTTDKKVDIGANDFYLAPYDLDVKDLISPLSVSLTSNTFQATFRNGGSATLSSTTLDVHYTVDSGKTWVKDTMNLTSLAPGAVRTFSFGTTWTPTRTGDFRVGIKIDKQVTGDPDTKDEAYWDVCSGLSGKFTVGPRSADYATIGDAVKALECGVAGPIEFEVQGGTYTGTLDFGVLNGATSTNTVTFKSAHRDSVTLTTSSGNVINMERN